MKIGNFAFELAEHRVEQERDAAIKRARASLTGHGMDDCEDCDRPIGEARKAAMPSATRCIVCQEAFERSEKEQAK